MVRSSGMNREKWVFVLVVSVLLAGVAMLALSTAWETPRSVYCYLFGSVPAESLPEHKPLTVLPSPSPYSLSSDGGPMAVVNAGRRTPFAPPHDAPRIITDEGGKVTGGTKSGGRMVPEKGAAVTETITRPSILDDPSAVTYVGVVGLGGRQYGMLRVRDGGCLNVCEGDQLTDFDCTVVRIEKTAIHVRTGNGIYHILRSSNAF